MQLMYFICQPEGHDDLWDVKGHKWTDKILEAMYELMSHC